MAEVTGLRFRGRIMSRFALGTWQFGGAWGDFDRDAAIRLIRRARELGVTTFDSARAYGNGAAERLLSDALRSELRSNRQAVLISTKGGVRMTPRGPVRDCSAEALRADIYASLEALRTDYVDIFYLHHPDPGTPLERSADELAALRDRGLIKSVGLSNFSPQQIAVVAERVPVDVGQYPYSLLRRDIESELLPFAAKMDMLVMAYGPLAHGMLTGATLHGRSLGTGDWRTTSGVFAGPDYERAQKFVSRLSGVARMCDLTIPQLALAWVLRNGGVQAVIIGAQTEDEVAEGVTACDVILEDSTMNLIGGLLEDAPRIAPLPGFVTH